MPEPDWLEWKSEAHLQERLWQARIAKFILGAANRPLDRAAKNAGGCAYMLLGVEPGRLNGVAPIDPAKLEGGLLRYLGTGGPVWAPQVVRIDEVTVMVITTEPTPPGCRPFIARATFSDRKLEIQNGRIYVRRIGSTNEATAAEMDEMLAERDKEHADTDPGWMLDVILARQQASLPRVDVSTTAIKQWRDAERARLTRGLDTRMNPQAAQWLYGSYGDRRTRAEFLAEVEGYVTVPDKRVLNEALANLASSRQAKIQVIAENRSEYGLPDLVVELSLPMGVDAVFQPRDLWPEERLAKSPTPFGEERVIDLLGIGRRVPRTEYGPVGPDRVDTDEQGSLTVYLGPQELRPFSRARLRTVTLLIPSNFPARPLEIPWRATSLERKGTASGILLLPISEQVIPLPDALEFPRSALEALG